MAEHRFFEFIKPGTRIEFIGRSKGFLGLSGVAMAFSILMLFLNAYVIPGRGAPLNWGVDFRGGTELLVELSKSADAGAVRKALEEAGYVGADVVQYGTGTDGRQLMIRLGAVSVVSEDKAKAAEAKMANVGSAKLLRFDWSEGGDKVYLRFDADLEPEEVKKALAGTGIETTQVQRFGRVEDKTYEATLISMDSEVREILDKSLGAGAVKDIPSVESVGAKAGRQLQIDGIKAVVGAILLIVLYVALRFDFRYGPGTIVALFHDCILTIGAFALTYREFSLTTLAAVLTIAGYSVNDTIVIFDRVRENAQRFRDRKMDRIVNQALNETLSRTILTSGTVLFVTLAMNLMGAGVVKDFAFTMNVGVVVGTYSTIFVAAPLLVWLDRKMTAAAQRKVETAGRRSERKRNRSEEETA